MAPAIRRLVSLSILRAGYKPPPNRLLLIGTEQPRQTAVHWKSTYSRSLPSQKKLLRQNGLSGICYIPNPSATDPSTVLAKLPKLLPKSRNDLNEIVFLITPGIVRWFEQGQTFHQDAVNHFFTSREPITSRRDSFVAVVDALPPPELFGVRQLNPDRPFRPMEGIAICLRPDSVDGVVREDGSMAPGVLRVTASHVRRGHHRSSNNVENGDELDAVLSQSVTIPLANTLFVNGLRNTAFWQTWEPSEDLGVLRPLHDPIALEELCIPMYLIGSDTFQHNVPLYPLTVPREVLSSMGNVVREVRGDDSKPLRASAELEALVPKMLAQQKERNEEAQFQIFAKATPPDAENENLDGSPPSAPSLPDIANIFGNISYQETTDILRRKGHIYRVTSGGGGWGKKAGLLSLDPATNFTPLETSDTGMFPDPDKTSDAVEAIQEVGALVPPGHNIQFFAAQIMRPETQPRVDEDGIEQTPDGGEAFLIGTIPSSDTLEPCDAPSDTETALPFAVSRRFGALSEGGASISEPLKETNDDGGATTPTTHEFRVDVPYSTFKLITSPKPTSR